MEGRLQFKELTGSNLSENEKITLEHDRNYLSNEQSTLSTERFSNIKLGPTYTSSIKS
jgi:hypothetical protein